MVERKTPGEIILLVFIYAAVTLVGFVCLYPMLYCLAASFSDPMKLLTHSGALFFPTGFSLRGYQVVMNITPTSSLAIAIRFYMWRAA